MKKFLIFILSILFLFCISGCDKSAKKEPTYFAEFSCGTFVIVESDSTFNIRILVHKETRVMYLLDTSVNGSCGYTVLLDADGKPLLWEGEL